MQKYKALYKLKQITMDADVIRSFQADYLVFRLVECIFAKSFKKSVFNLRISEFI